MSNKSKAIQQFLDGRVNELRQEVSKLKEVIKPLELERHGLNLTRHYIEKIGVKEGCSFDARAIIKNIDRELQKVEAQLEDPILDKKCAERYIRLYTRDRKALQRAQLLEDTFSVCDECETVHDDVACPTCLRKQIGEWVGPEQAVEEDNELQLVENTTVTGFITVKPEKKPCIHYQDMQCYHNLPCEDGVPCSLMLGRMVEHKKRNNHPFCRKCGSIYKPDTGCTNLACEY